MGSYATNGFGLYDTASNMWEWIQDHYTANYGVAIQSENRVLRGGSWSNEPRDLRSAYRDWFHPSGRGGSIGFRISRTD